MGDVKTGVLANVRFDDGREKAGRSELRPAKRIGLDRSMSVAWDFDGGVFAVFASIDDR